MLTNIEAMRLNFMLKNDNKVLEIPIIKIRPNKAQPRKTFAKTDALRRRSPATSSYSAAEIFLTDNGFGRITKGAVHRFKVFGKRVSHLSSP